MVAIMRSFRVLRGFRGLTHRSFGMSSPSPSASAGTTEGTSTDVEGFVNLLKQVEVDKMKTQQQQQPTRSDTPQSVSGPKKSFGELLRSSKLMQLGGIEGRTVAGVITDIVGDDLYINFGGKFHCVCKRPTVKKHMYRQGTKVHLRLVDFEMTSYFMGAVKDLTLLEADAILLGLAEDTLASLKSPEKKTDA